MTKRFPFKADTKITSVLGKGRFTLSAEIIPPRNGAEQLKVLDQVEALVESGAEFLSVTKGAGGSLRGGSLPIAQLIKEQLNRPCIAHFTCRDLTANDCENQLMDHHYFGIRNILALRGDPPDGQPNWQARDGGYNYAYQLIEQIKKLNSGIYLPRAGMPSGDQEATDFCIGAAAYPEHPDEKERLEYFRLKVQAGAQYGISDMIFDPEVYARFVDLLTRNQVLVPILPGSRILKSKVQADRMMAKFKVKVPSAIYSQLPDADGPDAIRYGTDLFIKFVERLKSLGAPGIHVYVIVDTAGASHALTQLRRTYPLPS